MTERLEIESVWQRVSPRYVFADSITVVLSLAMTAAVVALVLWLVFRDGAVTWIWGVTICALALIVVSVAFAAARARSIGWSERTDDLLVRRGVMFRRFVAVPYGRMQVVDITQGPVERMFGLKRLKFVTAAAASGIEIPGMPGTTAEELRDRLVAVSESRRAGL